MGADADEAMTRKLSRLKRDIKNSYDGDLESFKVSHVLHMIDARDVMGLYEVLTPQALHKYGLLQMADGMPCEVRAVTE